MGLQFLFSAALWALPLAGLPLILHLLFRQKAQVIPFSTLRFIQSSLRQNAARRKIQRWLLLACRALLLLLLIWALAQPARKLSASLLGGGTSTAAAIVVDTSYSNLLVDQQRTLLAKADDTIQDLLRTELRDAHVAIFRSSVPPASNAPLLAPAENYRGERWSKLEPTPSQVPLADRITAATDALTASGEDNKWLIVLTDAQTREFPRPLPTIPNCRTILIDLHPSEVRTAAISDVHTEPRQPRLGIPAQLAVSLSGRPNDVRQVDFDITPAGTTNKSTTPLPLAHFDNSGRAQLSTKFEFADASWLLVTARLTSQEMLPWATSRSTLVRVPPRQSAAVLPVGKPNEIVERMIRLALDPSEGSRAAWPVAVHAGPPKWDESLIAIILNEWPDAPTIQRMTDFAQRGGSLVLFIQPGLEATWQALDAPRQSALTALLPSSPQSTPPDAAYHASFPRPNDPILAGIDDPRPSESKLVITRLVRFVAGPRSQAVINAAPTDTDSGAVLTGLLWRTPIGDGTVYTWATLPDRNCGNLRVWDIFPPALVNAANAPLDLGRTLNVEIGQPITLPATAVPSDATEVDMTPPAPDAPVRVDKTDDRYIYADTNRPGLYSWRWRNSAAQTGQLGWSNVQLPESEARLTYRPLNELVPDQSSTIAAHSLDEVRQRLTQLEQPSPQWTTPIALVLLLLCVEALLGAMPKRQSSRVFSKSAVLGSTKLTAGSPQS